MNVYVLSNKCINIISQFQQKCLPYLKMHQIPLQQLMQWLQQQLDKKYSQKLQPIKVLFITFFNLSNQLILLYQQMKQKLQIHSQKQQYKQVCILLTNSMLVLNKLIQSYPKCIDYSFCQKFIKNFDINLNILCTYYHSLHHVQMISEYAKFQKEKIVQGINKLYTIESKIKQIFRSNTSVTRILAMVNDNKKLLTAKIETINRKAKDCKEKQVFLENFEPLIVQFYEQYMQHSREIQPKEDYKKSLIKMYFQLKHQLFSTQVALENLCKLPLQICEQAKEKKKTHSNLLQESCNTFSRWLGILLKPNYSLKNFKKIKLQQLTKSIQVIVKEYPHTNNYLVQLAEKNLQQVQNMAHLIIDIVKELQKIEHSGVITVINDYKDGLFSSSNSKKYIHKIIDYQTVMAKYYSLQDQVKKLKNLAQTVVLQEIGVKVNIIIEEESFVS